MEINNPTAVRRQGWGSERNGSKCKGSKCQRRPKVPITKNQLLARDYRRIAGAEAIVEPAAVPAPGPAIEAQVSDVQVAIGVAVNRAPETDCLALPGLGNQFGVSQQVVK